MNPYLIAVLAAGAIGFGSGFGLERMLKNGEIAAIQLKQAKAVQAAVDAKDAAEARAIAAERDGADRLALQALDYERKIQDEKAASNRVVADLRSGATRLRVSATCPASGSGVPAAAAAASGSDGAAQATLDPAVAARLAGRYADYNALVRQLELAQQTINEYLVIINAKEYPAVKQGGL